MGGTLPHLAIAEAAARQATQVTSCAVLRIADLHHLMITCGHDSCEDIFADFWDVVNTEVVMMAVDLRLTERLFITGMTKVWTSKGLAEPMHHRVARQGGVVGLARRMTI